MFLIKNCTQIFITLTNCFISENKNTDYVTPIYLFKACENVTKFMKITLNSTHNREKIQKAQNDKKTSFLRELVENADFHKPVSNKIKTSNE